MIFRITQKLAMKIDEAPEVTLPPEDNPFRDWHATLFTADRYQYILWMNTPSLYTIISRGADIRDSTSFIRRFEASLGASFGEREKFIFNAHIAPSLHSFVFSKTSDRSMLGSMNELVHQAQFHLTDNGLSAWDTTDRLNQIPMKALGYRFSREALHELIK